MLCSLLLTTASAFAAISPPTASFYATLSGEADAYGAALPDDLTDTPEAGVSTPRGSYKAVTTLDMEGATLEGAVQHPTVGLGTEVRHPAPISAIRLRENFNNELASSTDFVR